MPDPLPPIPGAPIDEDLRHERRQAVAGRAGRVALGVVVGLALLGVFGGMGPFTRTEVADPARGAQAGGGADRLVVRHDRFARLDAPTVIEVDLTPGDSIFVVGGALADAVRFDALQPTPAAEAQAPGGGLQITAGSTGATVRMHDRPMRAGRISGSVALPGGRSVAVRLFVYP